MTVATRPGAPARLLDVLEAWRFDNVWWSTTELAARLNVDRLVCRRALHRLHAAGMVARRGAPGEEAHWRWA